MPTARADLKWEDMKGVRGDRLTRICQTEFFRLGGTSEVQFWYDSVER